MKRTHAEKYSFARVVFCAIIFAALPSLVLAATHPLFNLQSTAQSPFPSDRFAVLDSQQITGLRVDLPLPNCGTNPSDCADITLLNQLDGFNLQPRLSIPFDGPIDVNTVNSSTIFLVQLPAADDPDGRLRGLGAHRWWLPPALRPLFARRPMCSV